MTHRAPPRRTRQLASQGFCEITLHTDDAAAVATKSMAVDHSAVTPAEQVELRYLSDWSFFLFVLKKFTWLAIVPLVASIGLLAYKIYYGQPLGSTGAMAVVMLLLPVTIAAWTTVFNQKRKYDALLEAFAWGRWEEVLPRAASLRGRVPDFELDAREAGALAALGRLDEALDRMRPYQDVDEPPRWMNLTRLGEVYDLAGEHDEALRCHEQAYRAAPENPSAELDYALALLKNETGAELAQQLIASAEAKPLGDLLQLLLPHVKGVLYLNTGKEGMALEAFSEARTKLAPLSVTSPLIHQILDIIAAYEAIALARTGQRREAIEISRTARERLRAINARRLLARLESALGLTKAHA